MAVSHVYPVIDFTLLDYDKIPIGTFLIGFDSSNGGKLCKMDHNGTITIIESGLLPSLTGLNYQGLWNADINNPTLTSSVGTVGDFYIVSVLGTTNLNGVTDWQVGDWAIFEGGAWIKVDNHDIQTYNTIKDESTILPQRSTIKFTGTGVTASDVAGETVVNIPIQPAYSIVKDEGSLVTQRSTINFVGGGVTASDIGGETVVNIPGVISSNSYGLFAQTANGPSVTGVTEQSIVGAGVGTLSVPANAFQIGDSFTSALDGDVSCLSSATLHIHVRTVGGVILADTGVINMSATTNKPWILTLYFTIRQLGGAGVAEISSGGLFSYIRDGGINFEGYVLSTINNTTFDTTVSNTLFVTAQWNTGSASNTIRSFNFTLQKIY